MNDVLGAGIDCQYADEQISLLAEHGYTYARFTSFHTLDDSTLAGIRTRAEAAGVYPFSAHAPAQFLPQDLNALETRLDFHRQVMDKAAILGVKSITYHVASVENVRDVDTAVYLAQVGKPRFEEANITLIRGLAQYGAPLGIAIALENRDHGQVADYVRTIDALVWWIRQVGEPNVGITLDTGHAHSHGDLSCAEMIRQAGPLLIDTHFHDNYGQLCDGGLWRNGATNDLHCPPGIGTVNWLAVVDALEAIQYQNPIMFEVRANIDKVDLSLVLQATRNNWRLICAAQQYVRRRLSVELTQPVLART